MKNKLKKHIGLIILLAIALVFPTSLNYQARLNMRIIVTGLAIDKSGEDYQVTAQIVQTSPGNEKPGTSAEIDFITDKGESLSEAVSNLSYKAGKVAAFSHTNFVVLGKSMFEEDITKCLDYFIRDKIIKNSALLLFASGSAEEELKKTQSAELSVGIGLQKVFLFKENEGDGLMITLIDFLNRNKSYGKSAVASELSFHTNEESKEGQDGSGSSSGGSSSSDSSSGSSGESSGSSGGDSGGSSGSSSGGSQGSSGGSSGGQSEQQYFDPEASIVCFVEGKYVGKIKDKKAIDGFMLGNKETKMVDILLKDVKEDRLDGDNIEIAVNKKKTTFKFKYEGNIPVLTAHVKISKCEINEIMTDGIIASLKDNEFKAVKEALKKEICECVQKCFDNAKSMGVDVFSAYEKAYKFHYKKTTEDYGDVSKFIENLVLNIEVEVVQMDY